MITRDCSSCSENSTEFGVKKCCDYFPFIPNYKVGEGLSEQPKLWKPLFTNKELIIQPLGILATKPYREKLKNIKIDSHCVFYSMKNGICKIWQNRPGYCESYFCNLNTKEELQKAIAQKIVNIEMERVQLILLEAGLIQSEIDFCLQSYNIGEETSKVALIFKSLKLNPFEFYTWCYGWDNEM